jgi:salicylate hydroxylase
MRRFRIVVAGAGVAGAIVARGLSDLDAVEVICLERAAEGDQTEAGTGLNVGPNAIKALALHMPDLARTVTEASMPWRRWTIDLTDGRRLFDLDLLDVADNPGIRIRWAELYRLLRQDLPIRYGVAATGTDLQPDGRLGVRTISLAGAASEIADVDLLIAADGRYSRLRSQLVAATEPTHLGISMYRVLIPQGRDCPIDEYGQWFNGPNRLLAFTVPGGYVYCAGTFPVESADGAIPDGMKDPEVLRRLYMPEDAAPSPEAAFLIDGIAERVRDIHWARAQEDAIAYSVSGWPVLFIGDASHPMIPTLGQGATQAVEDACCVVDRVKDALARGRPLGEVPEDVEAIRHERVRFVMDFSRDASDTMLAGADPVAGTLAKLQPDFQDKLRRLYREVPPRSAGVGQSHRA